MNAFIAQWRIEVWMTLRRGETLLLTLGIPVAFLAFFSSVHVISLQTNHPVNFYVPGILALSVMSTSMVSLGIATGFERSYGVLQRLGSTPLGRPRWLLAKIATVIAIEILQAIVLIVVGLFLGWDRIGGSHFASACAQGVALAVLASVGFGGIGLSLAGILRAEFNLGLANGLYIVLLLSGGMVIPLSKLPTWLADAARLFPAASLGDGLHRILSSGTGISPESWIVLSAWAIAAPLCAALTFRWE